MMIVPHPANRQSRVHVQAYADPFVRQPLFAQEYQY